MAQSVGIIGAGMAGLSCGEALIGKGYNVTIFEKSRGLSGRSSTRKVQEHRFDHGAQFFTAKSEEFRFWVEEGITQGLIAPWAPRLLKSSAQTPWFVGIPGMSSLGHLFACKQSVRLNCLVEEIQFRNGGWEVQGMCQQVHFQEFFDHVVLAIPSNQVTDLLHKIDITQLLYPVALNACIDAIDQIEMLPCWTVMLSIQNKFGKLWPYDAFQAPENELDQYSIAWLANNSSKPQRSQNRQTQDWVIQASPRWSTSHLENDPEEIVQALVLEMAKLVQTPLQSFIEYAAAHRWRYARVLPIKKESRFRYSSENKIGFCGDYFSTSRIESSFLSGHELANQIIKHGFVI